MILEGKKNIFLTAFSGKDKNDKTFWSVLEGGKIYTYYLTKFQYLQKEKHSIKHVLSFKPPLLRSHRHYISPGRLAALPEENVSVQALIHFLQEQNWWV